MRYIGRQGKELTVSNRSSNLQILDVMKVYGIVLVVFGHITRMYTDRGLCHPIISSQTLSDVTDIIYAFHMPMFVFISGCIFSFQYEERGDYRQLFDYRRLVWKKIVRLIVPYVFWSFLWVAPYLCLMGYRSNTIEYLFHGIVLSTDCAHLWYLLMLFICFLLFQTINLLLDNFKLPKLFILILAIILYCLPDFKWMFYFQLHSTKIYFLWFCFGYCFYIYRKNILKSFLFLIPILLVTSLVLNENLKFVKVPFLKEWVMALVGILAFFYTSKITPSFFLQNKLYKLIFKNNFGIYLIHPILIYAVFHFAQHWYIHPYLLCAVTFVLVIFLSIGISELLRKVNLGWAMGEKNKK